MNPQKFSDTLAEIEGVRDMLAVFGEQYAPGAEITSSRAVLYSAVFGMCSMLSHIVEALAPYEDLIFDIAREAEKEADAPALESERTR